MIEAFTASSLTTVAIGVIVWLCRNWILTRLTAAVRLETDTKVEELRSRLHKTNESVRAVTAAGHEAFTQAEVALLPHKIQAVSRIWSATLAWSKYTMLNAIVAVLDLDWVKNHGADPKTKANFEMMLSAPEHLEFLKDQNQVETVRPFVSTQTWALFAAYNAFNLSRLMKASMFLFPSFDHAGLWRRVSERDLVEKSAPSEVLKQYDENVLLGGNAYLEYLKEQLLDELQNELSGGRGSERALGNASAVIAAANALIQQSEQKQTQPGSVIYTPRSGTQQGNGPDA